jgi:hypothetical protein
MMQERYESVLLDVVEGNEFKCHNGVESLQYLHSQGYIEAEVRNEDRRNDPVDITDLEESVILNNTQYDLSLENISPTSLSNF